MLSAKLKAFEAAYDMLNRELFDNALSRPVITITPTPHAYGHFTPWKSWEGADGKKYCEINLGAENINRPIINVMATLVHELVHQYCYEHDLQDTSRVWRYHNKVFKTEAEKRGLIIEYDKAIGWSPTKPGDALLAMERRGLFKAADGELHRVQMGVAASGVKKKSSTRKLVCPVCGQSVRATKEVHIICGDCNERMEEE